MFPLTAPFEKPALENLFEAYVLLEFLLIQLYCSSSCFLFYNLRSFAFDTFQQHPYTLHTN